MVIDAETTGLSADEHRIVELATVRTDSIGRVVDEWVCRFNPEGPVGATHIHGIRDEDVRGAPYFRDLIPELNRRLSGGAVVGHNVRFDLAFLRSEYARSGWSLPWLPSLCTVEASWTYLPHLDRRRLADCCHAAGIRLHASHSALHDARATAALLACFLRAANGRAADYAALCDGAHRVTWPTGADGSRHAPSSLSPRARHVIARAPRPPADPLVALLDRLSLGDVIDEGASTGSLPYLELLAEALEDGELTTEESAALADLAGVYELAPVDVDAAHRAILLALAHLAADDGRITTAERDELYAVATLLGVDRKVVLAVLDHADAARDARLSANLGPLPASWSLGEPLRVGDKVVFTGCDDAVRDRLEADAQRLGVRVTSSVSRRTAMLVTDGSFAGTKAAAAAELGTRTVTPAEFATLLAHLQPAAPRALKSYRVPSNVTP